MTSGRLKEENITEPVVQKSKTEVVWPRRGEGKSTSEYLGEEKGPSKQRWMNCVNRDMRAIETTKDEVHDRTGWRRIVSAAATPQPSMSGSKNLGYCVE